MKIFTVSGLNEYTKALFEEDALLSDITLSGEISNFKRHSSGHLYFSLKDDKAAIAGAMFKWQAAYLRFAPANGVKVIVKGKVTLYEPSGQYQIVVSSMQPDGVGALYAAFEALRKKLAAEGLFAPERKRPIPKYPSRIGLVTSRTGAAVQDMINVLGRRYPLAELVLCPVMVQSQQAAAQMCRAVECLNENKACDVIIIGRGGGSAEDLWAFNDEQLARTVAGSRIPVISAVGHEIDFSICDFAADLRAPTPSAAAELAVPDSAELLGRISANWGRISDSVNRRISLEGIRLRLLCEGRAMSSPLYQIEKRSQQLDFIAARMDSAVHERVTAAGNRLSAAAARMTALNPMRVLARGYCAARQGERYLASASQAQPGAALDLVFADGTVSCTVDNTEDIHG